MSHLQTFQVYPDIPESLSFLEELSRNIWWCWRHDAVELFRRIDPKTWDRAGRNPILFLSQIPQKRLEELGSDSSYLAHLNRVRAAYETAVLKGGEAVNVFSRQQPVVAYFSMEFGIHESIPVFAGGLGVLAGDHLKTCSDMKIPLVGVGLLYYRGYFRQFLDRDGWQQEDYPEVDIYQLPIERAAGADGNDVYVTVNGTDGPIQAAVWRINVGCIPLFLLDTNLMENPPEIRDITARLYAGEQKIRLNQEILLGIGGMKALAAMNIKPAVCHMNEGHSAFCSLERLVHIMETHHVDLTSAMEIVPRTTVFTTHTPVAAGNEEFPPPLVETVLVPYQERLNIPVKEIIGWGQPAGSAPDAPFSMFAFGVRMAQFCNGVSKLHGEVARRMWSHMWPDRPEYEVPISHVTNGVHIPTWISHETALLFERYLGPDWYLHPCSAENVNRIRDIYDEELWRAHCMSRSRLIRTCRELMIRQYKRRHASKEIMRDAEMVLDQDILTIAFARRFATYKRGSLLLQDPARLEEMIMSDTRPVQFIFAGKAHPKDNEGKEFIKKLVHFSRRPEIRHRFIFLEDYDIHLARHLVHGADVWLNTPRRPFEACGTSGMKAAVNGVLNVSILDGWWCEGYDRDRGWRIGNGEEYADPVYQDMVESQALYNVLENDVIPCFYDRKNGDVPSRWLDMMKSSIRMAVGVFCSHRMVGEYDDRFYQPAVGRLGELLADDAGEAERLGRQKKRLKSLWRHVRIEAPVIAEDGPYRVGKSVNVSVTAHLGDLSPDEVDVEFYYGILKSVDSLTKGYRQTMTMAADQGDGGYLSQCELPCRFSGRYGFTARVLPRGDAWMTSTPGFITWA